MIKQLLAKDRDYCYCIWIPRRLKGHQHEDPHEDLLFYSEMEVWQKCTSQCREQLHIPGNVRQALFALKWIQLDFRLVFSPSEVIFENFISIIRLHRSLYRLWFYILYRKIKRWLWRGVLEMWVVRFQLVSLSPFTNLLNPLKRNF